MTTQTVTLNRIIETLKGLNEFDGETVEYLLDKLGYSDYMLRALIMKESMLNVENAYEERIEFERDHNNNIIKNPLVHRLEMIKDDIKQIEDFVEHYRLEEKFLEPTKTADSCYTHLANINIACDLTSEECLNWGNFRPKEETPEEKEAKRLGELVWTEYTMHTRKHFLVGYNVKDIKLILIVHEVWNDIENNDALTFNNFKEYWEFFIANRKNIIIFEE